MIIQYVYNKSRAADRMHNFISKMHISAPNLMFDHLIESSHRDDSIKWSNIGFGEEIAQVELVEVHFKHLIWGYDILFTILRLYLFRKFVCTGKPLV